MKKYPWPHPPALKSVGMMKQGGEWEKRDRCITMLQNAEIQMEVHTRAEKLALYTSCLFSPYVDYITEKFSLSLFLLLIIP